MIIGGNGVGHTYLKSVELYNWKTGKQCPLKDLPYQLSAHTSTVMDGVPVFCGGEGGEVGLAPQSRCFKLNQTDKSWTQVSYLIIFM